MSRVLLDVDGVLADFVGHLISTVNLPIKREDVVQWQLLDLLTDADRRAATRTMATPGYWATMPIVVGAREGVNLLRAAGHEVLFVTSPWLSCVGWEFTRRNWLVDRFGARPEDVIPSLRKDVVVGDVLVDDKADHVVAWHHAMTKLGLLPQAYLFSLPHNMHDGWPLRWSWSAVPPHLTRKV